MHVSDSRDRPPLRPASAVFARRVTHLALGAVFLLALGPGEAKAERDRWSVTPMLGIHSPRLKLLNTGEFRAPLPGRGRLIPAGVEEGFDFDFMIENPLPEMSPGTEAGIEVGLRIDERNSIFFGASVWESGSTSSLRTEIPFQGALTAVGHERSGRVSYFQYFIGWQRILNPDNRRYHFYSRVALHEVFDIDYREELVFGFAPPGAETFKRFIIMDSQATGHFMLQLGLGGEYFFRDWLSLGADMGYTHSARKFKLGNATLTSDIQPEDNLNFRTPVQLDQQQRLTYLAEAVSFDDVTYRDMELDFNGWRALFRVNMYF
jgi:hypothetical protein